MKKIVTVLGARPQFIKSFPLSAQIAKSQSLEEVILFTGQHYSKSLFADFLDLMVLSDNYYNLNIGSDTHAKQVSRMMVGIEEFLINQKPDYVVVYGDTNSTLAGAITAAQLKIPVAHIEAGLRSNNSEMIEELNRKVCDQVSTFLFTPCRSATNNCISEGIDSSKVIEVGDIMLDAVDYMRPEIMKSHILETLSLTENNYIVATIHRAENTDSADRLCKVFHILSKVASSISVVVPLHPRTKKLLQQYNLYHRFQDKITFIEPLPYIDMHQLCRLSKLIVTDSGGLQKEAYFHQVPCITLRTETEWHELVESGWNKLVSPLLSESDAISEVMNSLSTRPKSTKNIYGDGTAAKKITQFLEQNN